MKNNNSSRLNYIFTTTTNSHWTKEKNCSQHYMISWIISTFDFWLDLIGRSYVHTANQNNMIVINLYDFSMFENRTPNKKKQQIKSIKESQEIDTSIFDDTPKKN